MAPVLQCPDCNTKHPLNEVPDAGTFPCKGCGRALKVPETVPRPAPWGTPLPDPAPAPVVPTPAAGPPAANPTVANTPVATRESTRVMPLVTQNDPAVATAAATTAAASPAGTRGSGRAPVRWWMQLLLWIVAVPLAYFIVFLGARATGAFSSNQLSDVFLANGVDRFWPLVRLLPIVALLTAGLVQGGVVLLSRRNTRQAGRAR